MLSALLFFMIFVGVTISVLQIYNFHYNLNFGVKEKRSHAEEKSLNELTIKAKETSETGSSPGFIQAAKDVFGRDFDHRIVLAAFSGENREIYAEPLLRRKNNIVCNGKIKILHLPFWKTNPPKKDIRGLLLKIVFINCLLALFFGGLSVYTIAYEASAGYFSWFNNELILMLLIYALVLLTYVVSKFDIYMHDIYMIGKLDNPCVDDVDK
nr:hypothetical protein [uncultured Halomonas sp.]